MEATRLVGASGQPPFLDGSSNIPPSGPLKFTSVGFYKDHEGIVHLEGAALVGSGKEPIEHLIFSLPPGYRPPSGTILPVEIGKESIIFIFGSNFVAEGVNFEGDVLVEGSSPDAVLSGLSAPRRKSRRGQAASDSRGG
jgi:hypothetical protein